MRLRATAMLIGLALVAGACNNALRDDVLPVCPTVTSDGQVVGVTSGAVLVMQGTPTAERIPCIDQLRVGWTVTEFRVERGLSVLRLHSDRLGDDFLRIEVTPSCSPAGEVIPSDETGTELYVDVARPSDSVRREDETFVGSWWYVYPGGCTELRFDAEGEEVGSLEEDVTEAVDFFDRIPVTAAMREDLGLDD